MSSGNRALSCAGASSTIASVVIPAHNEQAVIARCLTALLGDARPGEFDVVVAANGCTDDTVRIALAHAGNDVRVVQTGTSSKIAALNLGDEAAEVLPRIFLDADVSIDTATARELARLLGTGAILAAAPRISLDTSRSSAPARAYLAVWQTLPVFRHAYVGSGCYALSAEGRARFDSFPDVTNDDQYINGLFAAKEKHTLAGFNMCITAPTTLRAIVHRSVRVRAGARELGASTGQSTRSHLVRRARRPRDAGGVVLFIFAQIVIRALAARQERSGQQRDWRRDETSRSPA